MNRYRFDDTNHLHSLDGKPLIGASSAMQIVSKPLTWWAAGKALEELGWTNPKLSKPTLRLFAAEQGLQKIVKFFNDGEPEGYLALLDRCYCAHDTHKNKAADKGTDMHAELEAYVKRSIADWEGVPEGGTFTGEHKAVATFRKWADENVKRFLYSEMYCFSESMWVGGISDCGAELKNGQIAVIDFKSSKEAYASQFWQAAGYGLLLQENGGFTKDGEKVFQLPRVTCAFCNGSKTWTDRDLNTRECEGCAGTGERSKPIDCHIIFPFGAVEPTAQVRYDVQSDQEAFKAAVVLYRRNKEFENQ